MEALDIEVIGINSVVSENIGSRSMEEFEQQMRELAAITETLRASFGVTLDSGGEKVFVTDDKGRIIEDRHFLTAFVRLIAKTTPGLIAVPVFAPAIIEQLVTEAGGRVQRVRASAEAQMGLAAREHPLLVADGLGGFIFPRFHPSFDGLFAIVKLLELLARARGDEPQSRHAPGLDREGARGRREPRRLPGALPHRVPPEGPRGRRRVRGR